MSECTDFEKSLDELEGVPPGDLDEAPTDLVRSVNAARAKPLSKLKSDEIGQLVLQQTDFPFLLDLVFPMLIENPLFDGGYYPGDVLSNLIRSPDSIWSDRPHWQAKIPELYRQAMSMPEEENDAFRDSLGLLRSGQAN